MRPPELLAQLHAGGYVTIRSGGNIVLAYRAEDSGVPTVPAAGEML
jgi:hypothetical protein